MFRNSTEAFALLLRIIENQARKEGDSPRAIARQIVGSSMGSYYRMSDRNSKTGKWAALTPDCDEYKDLRGWLLVLLLDANRPLTIKGLKFAAGRPKGAIGPIAKRIAQYLEKHPKAPATEVWEALKAKPRKGYEFMDNRYGKYIDGPSGKSTGWGRFCNIVSEQRPKKRNRQITE